VLPQIFAKGANSEYYTYQRTEYGKKVNTPEHIHPKEVANCGPENEAK
jgi:hypothetical protein